MLIRICSYLITCFCLCLAGLTSAFGQNDFQIVPGIRAGAVTARVSESELKKIYGKKNVRSTKVGLGEGETLPGTVIYPNDPRKKIEIVWKNKRLKKNPAFVQFTGDRSVWKTAQGIGLGTTLKYLEKINGKAFTLAGFEWDYSGTVLSWNGGKLAKTFGKESEKVTLRLDPRDYNRVPKGDLDAVLGDGGFASNKKEMQRINPRVYQMIVNFP